MVEMQILLCRGALIFLALLIFLSLLRAVLGPSVADRIVAVNTISTMVMVIIAILAFLLHEGYLVDICLIYAMVSFLAVIVLTKVYLGVYRQRKIEQEKTESERLEQGKSGRERPGQGKPEREKEQNGKEGDGKNG